MLMEFRLGELSNDTHGFLHGSSTTTPGSWRVSGGVHWGNGSDEHQGCKREACAKLCGLSFDTIRKAECSLCKAERKRRMRVVAPADNRLKEPKFESAIAIVANNDLKYEICKSRAAKHARDTKQRIVWSPARDVVKSDCLASDKHLHSKKESWLQYHSKKCGGHWGMVPLVKGMRVALVEHLDRSDKCLLRGSAGELLGWVLDSRERTLGDGVAVLEYPPKALIVKFDGAAWNLPNMDVGVYPIKSSKTDWYLDECKQLRVTREQVPVGPDYARTAYSTQGLTLNAALVDLVFDLQMDPATAYVALSRVRSANDIVIIQPFDIEPFQQGCPIGPKLLLKKLRGESMEEDIKLHEHKLLMKRAAEKQQAADKRAEKQNERKQKRRVENLSEEQYSKKTKRSQNRTTEEKQTSNQKRTTEQIQKSNAKRTTKQLQKMNQGAKTLTAEQKEKRRYNQKARRQAKKRTREESANE